MIKNSTDSRPTNYLAVAGSFLTKSFARFEYKFLNNSDIVRVSKVNLSFALR